MLTYCTNIHPGESWREISANLRRYLPAVKRASSPGASFPVGLWLPALAASQIDGEAAARFADWCAGEGCHVASLNGFPHGRFHGRAVKQRVYLPDWRSPERLAYTARLADLLAGWLPEGARGSISSVPL